MAYQNLLQRNLQDFARLAKKHGWTYEEILEVVEAVNDDIRHKTTPRPCSVADLLRKYAAPVIERKRKEQENKKNESV